MKRFLLLPLLAIICFNALAQGDAYSDILAEGKTWNYVKWPNGTRTSEAIKGDTVVAGYKCKRYGYLNSDGAFHGLFAYRQEGDRVYRHNRFTGGFDLVYDFGASAGDTIPLVFENSQLKILVTGVGNVRARGHVLRRVSYRIVELYGEAVEEDGRDYGVWIEGIGGIAGLDTSIEPVAGDYRNLVDVTLDGETLYGVGIFSSPEFDKRMLTYSPSWVFNTFSWDALDGGWKERAECKAYVSGEELPPPKMFVYSAVTVEPGGGKLLLREAGGRVYVQRGSYAEYFRKAFPDMGGPFEAVADWSEDAVLYDFTLGAGDVYPCEGGAHVASVSSMTTRDGLERKVLFLDNGLEIIEGIGCVNSPLGVFAYQKGFGWSGLPDAASFRSPSSSSAPPAPATLESFTKYGDDEPLFVKGDELSGISLPYGVAGQLDATYDLQGRRVAGTPQRGVYIRGGRKFVVR